MRLYPKTNRFKTVITIELLLIAVAVFVAASFWQNVCGNSLRGCLGTDELLHLPRFLLLAIIRPFVFTPVSLLPAIAAESFGTVWGALLNAGGAVLSGLVVFFIARLVGQRIVMPWLKRNLPRTHGFMRSQDYKVILLLRLFPFAYFDLCSFIFGLLAFRVRHVVIFTFIGILPESFLIAHFAALHADFLARTVLVLLVLTLALLIPALTWEILSHRSSLITQIKAIYRELLDELQENNELIKRTAFSPQKTPLLLLYGFFSSRNCLMITERILTSRGYDVVSFNLGGLLGVFFTENIIDSAKAVDRKLQYLFERHNFNKINIVAHSKGGLVALWLLLKLGGTRYCDKIITMGTPFCGSKLTYIALMTPLGLMWHDLWQMRPNSSFLRDLHDSEIPESLQIYCMHSLNDSVATGEDGIFKPRDGNVTAVPMNHVRHFEFLNRRDVGDMISLLLRDER